jgi:hypothetical protein
LAHLIAVDLTLSSLNATFKGVLLRKSQQELAAPAEISLAACSPPFFFFLRLFFSNTPRLSFVFFVAGQFSRQFSPIHFHGCFKNERQTLSSFGTRPVSFYKSTHIFPA